MKYLSEVFSGVARYGTENGLLLVLILMELSGKSQWEIKEILDVGVGKDEVWMFDQNPV